jgi:hypothetical protein
MELEPGPLRTSTLIEDAMMIVGPSASAKNLLLKSVVNPNVPEWLCLSASSAPAKPPGRKSLRRKRRAAN